MKRKNPYRFTCYVPVEKEPFFKEFLEIADREGSSGSEKIVEFALQYRDQHRHGNPQTVMQRYIKDKVEQQCFGCKKLFSQLKRVRFLSGQLGNVCPDCEKDYDERRLIVKKFGVI